MLSPRAIALTAIVAVTAIVACDNDPTRNMVALALTGCPTGTLDVNQPLSLSFNQRVLPASITTGNVVVSNAATGVQFPGTLALDTTGTTTVVRFVPSQSLPFGTRLVVRIQNLISTANNTAIAVTSCDLTTSPAPITQLYWRALPPAPEQIEAVAAYVVTELFPRSAP